MLRVSDSRAKVAGLLLLAFVALVLGTGRAEGQVPTGTLSGRVADSQGAVISGATVTVSSPNLISAPRTTTTDNGDFIVRGLPPGRYTVVVETTGFNTATRGVDVAPTETVNVSFTVTPAVVQENITVSTEATSFVDTVQSARNIVVEDLRTLPTARTLLSYVDLTPAVRATGPDGARSINGAMSFENVYMLNGVQIQDNLRGTPLNLFIEDAIEETTVSASGISAEYGRFSGGIVNAITKSGGNEFGGSFRVGFTNDSWRTTSPENEPKVDTTVPVYEFTFGGPLWRDRTWFFAAGRFRDEVSGQETVGTDLPYELKVNEKRYEAKVTHAIAPAHRVFGSFVRIDAKTENDSWPSADEILDLNSLVTRNDPQSLFSLGYTGSFGARFFVDAHFSQRRLTFEDAGGMDTDLIRGTTMCTPSTDCLGGVGTWFWAPAFCGVCTNETRDSDQFFLKGSYFLSTESLGAHNLTFGYDRYADKTLSDNHQSATDFHVWSTDSIIQDGVVYPVIGDDGSTFIINWPIALASDGANFRTDALFFNDSWQLDDRWSFQLGLRYDRNDGVDASGNVVSDDSMISPRLGAAFSPNAGRTTLNTSFGRYVATIASSIGGSASPAGNPGILAYAYLGDGINNSGGPLVPTDAALRQVFDWFNASGGDSLFFADVPGVATRFPRSLDSPHTDEFTAGVGQNIGLNASLRVDYVERTSSDFYADQIDQSTGQVSDEFGQVFDLKYIVNTDTLKRRFRALNAQFNYQRGNQVSFGMSYSLSRLWGNVNGETSGSGPVTATDLSYPEYSDPSFSNPEGDLAMDQRHRARIFGTFGLPFPGAGNELSLGLVQIAESGSPYGAVGGIDTDLYVENPGYATPPSFGGVTYYFTPRDEFHTEAMFRTDVALNYSRRFGTGGSEFFAQFQLLNVFNQFQVFNISGNAINTTVFTAAQDPSLAPFNPFTETPVEGVNWRKGDDFGKPRSAGAYTVPRMFRFSLGFRF